MAVDSEGFETCWNPQLKNFIVVLIGCISIVNVVIGLGLGVLCDTAPTDMNPSATLSKPNHHRYNKQPLHTRKKVPASVLQVFHLQCFQSVAGPRIELGTS